MLRSCGIRPPCLGLALATTLTLAVMPAAPRPFHQLRLLTTLQPLRPPRPRHRRRAPQVPEIGGPILSLEMPTLLLSTKEAWIP